MTDAPDLIVAELQRRKVLTARQLALTLQLGLSTVQTHLAVLVRAARVHRESGRPCRYALDPAHFWAESAEA